MRDYTAVVMWPHKGTELVDCKGRSIQDAIINLKKILNEDYNPDWKIVSIAESQPLITTWSR